MRMVQILALVLVTLLLSGCAVVGGIFKAGVFGGVVAILLLIAIIGLVAYTIGR